MNKIEVLKECPVCSNKRFGLLREEEWYGEILKISRCNRCKVAFVSRRFKKDFLKSINLEAEAYNHHPQSTDRSLNDVLKKIVRIKKSGNWLDIGCGIGELLMLAKKNHFSCYGNDLFYNLKDQENIKFYKGNLFDCNFKNEKFDIVTMINVLDHTDFPGKYLKEIYRILSPQGIFLLRLPNEHYFNSTIFNRFSNISSYYPYIHLVSFSQSNIIPVLKEIGFSKVKFTNPRFRCVPGQDKIKKILIHILEAFNDFLIPYQKGFWPLMQIIAYK